MKLPSPKSKTHFVKRRYGMVSQLVHDLFKLPKSESVWEVEWDKSSNELVITTLHYPEEDKKP